MRGFQKVLIPLLSILCVLSAAVMIVVLAQPIEPDPAPAPTFVPPPFDDAALEGSPSVPDGLGWSLIRQDGMGCSVGICGNLIADDRRADVYFYNPPENAVWLKLRVFDSDGGIIAETGLIRPGEYLREIHLETEPKDSQNIRLKIMAYEPDTYYSAGSVVLNTRLRTGE